jgi:hypothetical protein
MNAIIFIEPAHFGQVSGSTSKKMLIAAASPVGEAGLALFGLSFLHVLTHLGELL